MRKIWLPDVNVWIALAFRSHVNHSSARSWFDNRGDDICYFCRSTQQGFLRLATNSKAVGSTAVPMQDAWRLYDQFLNDAGVDFAAEPIHLENAWRNLSQLNSLTPNLWTDAYLAAFAISAGLELITFDRGFGRFSGLVWTKLV